MRITKIVTVEQEIEVDICSDDIAAVLAEDAERPAESLMLINKCAAALKAVPSDHIAHMNDSQRSMIATFLSQQSNRYTA